MPMSHSLEVLCVHPGMSQSPTVFTVNILKRFHLVCNISTGLEGITLHGYKIEICFMCLKLIFISPDYSLPALTATKLILSAPDTAVTSPMSLALMQGCSQARAQLQAASA